MVGAQAIKSKGAYDERVNEESNLMLKNGHKGGKYCVYANTPMEVDNTHVTVSDVNVSRDIVGYSKASQGRF